MESKKVEDLLGVVYWVHVPWKKLFDLDRDAPVQAVEQKLRKDIAILRAMGIRQLRTNLSWAEGWTPNGLRYQRWYIGELARHFELLPCINYTPPRLTEVDRTNAPPRHLQACARYVRQVTPWLQDLGVRKLQIWNEPNLNTDYDDSLDPSLGKLAVMLGMAAETARQFGLYTVMGGMNKLDLEWLGRFIEQGGLQHFDAVGFNSLRATWSEKELPEPWESRIDKLRSFIASKTGRPVTAIMTETGYPTIDARRKAIPQHLLEAAQVAVFADELQRAAESGLPMYWYTLADMPYSVKSVRAVTTGVEDIIQHHFGCVTADGRNKLLGRVLLEGGPEGAIQYVQDHDLQWLSKLVIDRHAETT